MINIALVGLGYWGPNLARNLSQLRNGRLHTLCDKDPRQIAKLSSLYPTVHLETEYAQLLENRDIDAIVVATPARTHFSIAQMALDAGKHVLVEKPMAASSAECHILITRARTRSLTLMVGHVFMFNNGARLLQEYLASGSIGRICYIHSERLSRGPFHSDVSVLWDLAPHDLSLIEWWCNERPTDVSANARRVVHPTLDDVVLATFSHQSGALAHLHLSWLEARKVRRITVVGETGLATFEEDRGETRIVVHRRPFEAQIGSTASRDLDASPLLDTRVSTSGSEEPLGAQCQHFVDCILEGRPPLTNGDSGLRVVEALEAAERAARSGRRELIGDGSQVSNAGGNAS